MADVFGDARWHPILTVVNMLGFVIDRENQLGRTSCPNPKHEGQPRFTCLLFPRKNVWRCTKCGKSGDLIDFVALALRLRKIEAARWIIRECRLLPEWERFEEKHLRVKEGSNPRKLPGRT